MAEEKKQEGCPSEGCAGCSHCIQMYQPDEGFQKAGESVFGGQKSHWSDQWQRRRRQIHGDGFSCKNDD